MAAMKGPSTALGFFAVLTLAGCDKIREHDAMVAAMTERKAEIASLQKQLDTANQRITALEVIQQREEQRKQATPPAAQRLEAEDVEALKRVIAECVRTVRSNAPKDHIARDFYSGFDAYYNPASGRVQNNNIYNGGLPAVYAFNKCMAANGWPLS